jgi:hypothetical protein
MSLLVSILWHACMFFNICIRSPRCCLPSCSFCWNDSTSTEMIHACILYFSIYLWNIHIMYCSIKKSALVSICGALLVINIVTDNYWIKLMGIEFVPEVTYIIISRFISSRILRLISLASIANYDPPACIIVECSLLCIIIEELKRHFYSSVCVCYIAYLINIWLDHYFLKNNDGYRIYCEIHGWDVFRTICLETWLKATTWTHPDAALCDTFICI